MNLKKLFAYFLLDSPASTFWVGWCCGQLFMMLVGTFMLLSEPIKPLKIQMQMPAAISFSMIAVDDRTPLQFTGISFQDGNRDRLLKAVESHQMPPRCRNVEIGESCIDWLEKGEKSFPPGRPK